MDTVNGWDEIPVFIDELFPELTPEERDKKFKELVYKISTGRRAPSPEMEQDINTFSADALAQAYLALRDRRYALKKNYEDVDKQLEEQQDEISAALISLCEKLGASTIRTNHGTVTRKTYTNYTTNDWGSLYSIINQYQAPYLLEKRIVKSAMESFLQEHPEAYPPGMQVNSKYIISIRKPNK